MKKIIIILISILLISFILLIYITKSGSKYEKELINLVTSNYKLDSDIKYINKYNDYYIFKTNKYLTVLDLEYNEIKVENADSLFKLDKEYDIIYKRDTIMYEVKSIKNKKITYYYYSITDGSLIENIDVGG